MQQQVDLVVNTYERTYRSVLRAGFFLEIEAQNRRPFERRVALINNVHDPQEARARAEELQERGEIHAYYFVADRLDRALEVAGLTRRDLGRAPHHSDCSLVAVTLPGSPWLLYCDAEVRLREPSNWIDPALALMENDRRVMVANPNWPRPTLAAETLTKAGDFALGYGFSDQLYLVRRAELCGPIYNSHCLASLRYSMAHIAPIFEQRVDAHMRTHGRLRATYRHATYEHLGDEGASYPPLGLRERVLRMRNRCLVALLRRVPATNPCLKV